MTSSSPHRPIAPSPRPVARAAATILRSLSTFSQKVIGITLYSYQLEPIQPILQSLFQHSGREFLLIFPRQSGKNELIACLLVYLLNLYQRTGCNILFAAVADGVGRGLNRLEQRLKNPWNRGHWKRKADPKQRTLGAAAVTFLSSHPNAHARGDTANPLMVIDELQDQIQSHIESVFTPMRAAHNASTIYLGTVKFTHDALWQKKIELEKEQAKDGQKRVWIIYPDRVTAENPFYSAFLADQVRQHGRHHPIIASEYFLEPVDGAGGLFPPRRIALMRGDREPQQHEPNPDELYVAVLDVAGQDEAATDPIAQLTNPGRDYTACTIFHVSYDDNNPAGPHYAAATVFMDQGSRHFEDYPGRPMLATRLLAFLELWNVAHLVADESGVGQGLKSWLAAAMGPSRVTGFNFAGAGKKAELGSRFLSLIETGRFSYFHDDQPYSDSWWFFQQAQSCAYDIPPNGRFDRDLRWYVPTHHKTDTPSGPTPTHDDRLLSAALIAELDHLVAEGKIVLGQAYSEVIPARDPLANLESF